MARPHQGRFEVQSKHTLAMALILFAMSPLVTAGGPVQQLPQDGCWVKYFLEIEISTPDGVTGKHTGSWTISSVGSKTVNKDRCRWIEIEEHIDQGDDGKPLTRWFKCLVREKDLRPGGDPLRNLVECWRKDTSQALTAVKCDNRFTMLPMYLRGTPSKTSVIPEPKRVAWQRGNLTIEQAEEQNQTVHAPDETYRMVIRDVVWKQKDIPFGTAELTSSLSLKRAGFPTYTWVHRLSLVDHGTGAKTKIANAK